jgi:hypothetical protein
LVAEVLPSPAASTLLAQEVFLVVAAGHASLAHVPDDAAQAVPIRSSVPEVLDHLAPSLAPKAVADPSVALVAVHRVLAAVEVAGVATGAEEAHKVQAAVAGAGAAGSEEAQAGVAGAGAEEAHKVQAGVAVGAEEVHTEEAEETPADRQIVQVAVYHGHTSLPVMAAGDQVEAGMGGWQEYLCQGAGHTGLE